MPDTDDRNRIKLTLDKENFKDERSIIAFVDTLHDESKHYKWPYERQWYYNINFYLGRQWVIPNDSNRRFQDKRKTDPKWRVRHVANKIKSFIIRKIAKLTRDSPVMNVTPATGDPEDINKARLADKVIEHLWNKLELEDKLTNEGLLWTTTCGNSFLKSCWNPTSGPKFKVQRGGVDDSLFNALAKATYKSKDKKFYDELFEVERAIGDVDVQVVSPFAFFCHPNARRLEDSIWCLESTIRDLDSLSEHWGDAADGVKEESEADLAWAEYEERLLENAVNSIASQRTRSNFPKVIEKQLWVKPCRVFPAGKYVVVAGGKLLHNDDFPYEHGKLPYVHLKDVFVPGRFWGQAQLEDAIPPQKLYNSLISKRQENINVHANTKWTNPKGSGVSRTAFDNEPGTVLDYVEGKKPEQVVPPPFPPAVMELAAQHAQDFDDITGQQEASRGIAPGRVDSSRGIMALQEADDTRLGPMNKHLRRGYSRLGSHMLSLVKQYYREDRLLKVVGKKGIVEIQSFTGTDIVGGGFDGEFDVRVQIDSGLPLSRSARGEFVMNLAKSGIFDPNSPIPPRIRENLLRVLELGGPRDSIFEDVELARSQAHMENSKIASGEGFPPNFWDDDDAHYATHEEFERAPDYFRLLEADPSIAQRMFQHKLLHQQAKAAKAMWLAQLQAAAMGGMSPQPQGPQAIAGPQPQPQPEGAMNEQAQPQG